MALYHTARGSVDYTVVGSPTIVDGVASGFSTNDYLVSSSHTPSSNLTSYDMQVKFTTSTFGTGMFLCGASGDAGGFRITSAGVLRAQWYEGATGQDTGVGQLSENTTYIATMSFSNSVVSIKVFGTNSQTPILNVDYSSSSFSLGSTTYDIGYKYISSAVVAFNGSIDLNHTYIMINGQPWFGVCPVEVKKHQLRGPVGYTVVGSPTIVDGVASGFSDSNYLTLTSNLPTSGVKTLEVFAKFTPNTTSRQDILAQNNYYSQLGMWIDGGRRLYAIVYMGQGSPSYTELQLTAITIQAGHTYYGKLTVSTETREISLSISEDKQNWTTASKTASRDIVINDASYRIGKAGVGAFDGSIDLNETYIKVNGKLWYYQPAPTKYIIREDKDTHNQSLVFADQGLYLNGPVNYEVVGSPTIVDGVVSGFSTSNYLTAPASKFLYDENDWELRLKFRLNSIPTGYTPLFKLQSINEGSCGFYIMGGDVVLQMLIYIDGVWKTLKSTDYTFVVNQDYWLKITKTGNDYAMALSDNGTSFTTTSTLTPATAQTISTERGMIFGVNGSNIFSIGSIDLKETYIKKNGSLWFYGKNYATKNIAPLPAGYHTKGQVGCVAVGSPTVADGIASGFSANDYLQLSAFGTTPATFHLHAKIKTPATVSSSGICGASTYNGNWGIVQYGDSTFGCVLVVVDGGSNKYLYITSNVPTPANAIVELDQIVDLSHLVMTLSVKQGGSVIYSGSKDIPSTYTEVQLPTNYLFGKNQYGPFDGSIDLNGTYIKVNGQPWFDGRGQYPFAGYVDMRTQQFTAAPSGATIGRDE